MSLGPIIALAGQWHSSLDQTMDHIRLHWGPLQLDTSFYQGVWLALLRLVRSVGGLPPFLHGRLLPEVLRLRRISCSSVSWVTFSFDSVPLSANRSWQLFHSPMGLWIPWTCSILSVTFPGIFEVLDVLCGNIQRFLDLLGLSALPGLRGVQEKFLLLSAITIRTATEQLRNNLSPNVLATNFSAEVFLYFSSGPQSGHVIIHHVFCVDCLSHVIKLIFLVACFVTGCPIQTESKCHMLHCQSDRTEVHQPMDLYAVCPNLT